MLEAIFTSGIDEVTVVGLTQWDRGQAVRITCPDLPSAFQVHFANRKSKKALVIQAEGSNNAATVTIPDEILREPFEVFAYLYFDESLTGETVKTIRMPIEKRRKPDDYIIVLPEEQATDAEKIVIKLMDEYLEKELGAASSASESAAKAEAAAVVAENASAEAEASAESAATNANASATNAVNASNYAGAANSAKDAAQAAQSAAEAAQADVKANATAASASAANAAKSESNAATSETNAANSAKSAAASEANAKASETAAKTSETNASDSASSAATSETNAANSKTAAQNAQQAAEQAKADAQTAASNAEQSASDAASDAAAASTSAGNASQSEQASAASATAAKQSETNAKSSEEAAASSKNSAATSASNAQSSATAAAGSASSAQGYAASSEQAKTDAQAARDAAQTAQTGAETAQAAAEKARNDAQAIVGGDFASTSYVDNKAATAESNANQYTDQKVAAVDVNSPVNTHNTNTSAHNDIRLLIEGLTTRLNALADSDDTTLDQMSEVVAYIKANKALIDSVTTNKVNVADIINNLTTNVSNKPLSAAQGVALKSLVDAASSAASAAQNTANGKANASHGNHVPTTETANNARYLRNDNTWQTVTPANIGAAPTSHASTGTGYGIGTGSNYGHVKLSDSTSSTSAASAGIAASPAAVKAAYDLANTAKTNAANAIATMTVITLSASGWNSSSMTQTATVSGILADETKQYIDVAAHRDSEEAIAEAGIKATSQGANSITFTAEEIPTVDIKIVVKWESVNYV